MTCHNNNKLNRPNNKNRIYVALYFQSFRDVANGRTCTTLSSRVLRSIKRVMNTALPCLCGSIVVLSERSLSKCHLHALKEFNSNHRVVHT